MFRARFRIALASAFLGLAAPRATAQALNPGGLFGLSGEDAGVPAFSFLKLPISARNVALGGRSLTTDEEASAVHGNPAALGTIADYYYSLSHAEVLGEMRHEDLALTWPTRRSGTLGFAANVLTTGELKDARDIDEEPAAPSAYDLDLSFAYGRMLVPGRLSAGARLQLIRSSLDGTAAHGYALSGGVLFFLVRDLRVSASVHNLSHGVRYESSGPLEPLPLGLGLEAGKPLLGSRWSAQAGVLQGNDGLLKYYAGGEWRALKYLILRAGYEGASEDRELSRLAGLSGGVGVKYDRLTLDYGYKAFGTLGAYHGVTLNYSRKAKFKDLDEVHLQRAQELRRKGKYKRALAQARKAAAANPYNLKAQVLARQLEIEIETLDETAFSVFYTANNGGALASQWIDGRALGGLARRKTKLLELKGAGGKSLILDAGDLTNPAARTGHERYVHAAYARMPYDAVNVGAGEILLGAEKWDAALPMLSSQEPLPRSRSSLLRSKLMSLRSGIEVKVMGALDGSAVRGEALGGGELEPAAEAVRREVASGAGGGKRLHILLLRGSLTFARDLALKVPGLTAILLSGETQALGSPMKVGNTLLCAPGRHGTHIGQLTLILDRKGGVRSFRHLLIPVDGTIPEDPEIKRLLEGVTVDPNQFALDGDDDYRAQVLAYVNAGAGAPERGGAEEGFSHGGGRLHLRDLRSGKDYTVLTGGLACFRPILGYGKNKVAFIGADTAGPAPEAREVYSADPGLGRLDTLTRMGGRARDIRWILGHNALLAAYAKEGKGRLYRVDPWSREVRDLSGGRFGDVTAFDVGRGAERLAVIGKADARTGGAKLWITDLKMESQLEVAAEKGFVGSPRWSPDGGRLAYLIESEDAAEAGGGELRVFDFLEKKRIPATLQSRVRDFSWSADGKRIYYVAGVNLLDINEFSLDSLLLRKVTEAPVPRSEESPTPKVLNGRDGLLFEAASGAGAEPSRRIHWLDLATGREQVLVDSAGRNSLK